MSPRISKAMTAVGHEDPFPRPRPNGRSRFGQEVRAGDQFKDCKSARINDPTYGAAARRRGHRMSRHLKRESAAYSTRLVATSLFAIKTCRRRSDAAHLGRLMVGGRMTAFHSTEPIPTGIANCRLRPDVRGVIGGPSLDM